MIPPVPALHPWLISREIYLPFPWAAQLPGKEASPQEAEAGSAQKLSIQASQTGSFSATGAWGARGERPILCKCRPINETNPSTAVGSHFRPNESPALLSWQPLGTHPDAAWQGCPDPDHLPSL